MVITYYGQSFLKMQVGDMVIASNPVAKDAKAKTTRFGADIGLVSMNHPDFNGVENLAHGDKEPFIIRGPGEYEIQEIFITGIGTKTTYDKEEHINTIYALTFEGMNICILGALGDPNELTDDVKAKIGDVDILFVPIGGGDVLDPASAYNKVAVKLEPHLIIPTHYEDGKKDTLKTFLKEGGSTGASEAEEKLTVKKKDVVQKEGEIAPLAPAVSSV